MLKNDKETYAYERKCSCMGKGEFKLVGGFCLFRNWNKQTEGTDECKGL